MSGVNARGDAATPFPDRDELIRAARSAALGELVPSLVHELNNPLLAILGIVDLLVADAEPASHVHRRLGVVRETAVEMRTLLRTVREFTREADGTRGRVDVGAAALETAALVRGTSSAADVEVVTEVPPQPLVVAGSREEIRQALLHLLANAFAAVVGGGTVTVTVGRRGEAAAVTIGDSGPGVAAGLENRIFEPFFTTRPGHGGLGLAAARAIAERHGGTVELVASRGGGAAFVLTLAAAEAIAAE